ncbi:hypothetical protein [Spongiibacter tropicus]|uniref:hypothetical protein n=1 Tax=Spongiibacter tropicus TaxID=454602 RepID=UPI002355AD36|nr:hypothetical protein [Spongiibacter tropicus]|tara:strand:- start:10287 stop:11153 length:867 start_codon:yes stop_codon:yes gene_type:complete
MTRNSYFIDSAENGMGLALVLKGPWSDDFIGIIKKEHISVLRLSYSAGWKGENISFLENLQGIGLRGVEVYAWDIKDITPLEFIPDIEYLGLQCQFTKAPDFSGFRRLKICKFQWRPKAISIFNCSNLEVLNIINYREENLKILKNMPDLKRLQITSRKLTSLTGIELLEHLRILDLAECTNLKSLDGIEKCKKLQIVELENCKRVSDVSSLGALANLRQLVLTNCGHIISLQPLTKCLLLERLTFNGDTNVEDGELTPLLDIPELKQIVFVDRQHYTQKREQISAML